MDGAAFDAELVVLGRHLGPVLEEEEGIGHHPN